MANRSIAIFGATSDLAQAISRQLATEGCELILFARDKTKLETLKTDLEFRGAQVSIHVADFEATAQHDSLVTLAAAAECIYLVYGMLPDQALCEASWEAAEHSLRVNLLSTMSILSRIANLYESRKSGSIVVISSVAGDRGRKANYIYGTAKGGLSLFCQGLRNRLANSGVRLLTVKPGFIDTSMTANIEKKPALLWATPERVANDVIRAEKRGADILYTPWFWRGILLIICAIPERLFKRLSI